VFTNLFVTTGEVYFKFVCRLCDCSCHVHLCSLLCCSFVSATALVALISCSLHSAHAKLKYNQYATLHTAVQASPEAGILVDTLVKCAALPDTDHATMGLNFW
jgi:hypothetical protein